MQALRRLPHAKNSFFDRHQLTHFVCIPLVSPAITPALRAALNEIFSNASAANIPNDYVRPVGTLHLNVSGGLNLADPKRYSSAVAVLRQLNLESILASGVRELDTHKLAFTGNRSTVPSGETDKTIDSGPISPLTVNIESLFCPPGQEAETYNLNAKVSERSGRLRILYEGVDQAYRSAGLPPTVATPPPGISGWMIRNIWDLRAHSKGIVRLANVLDQKQYCESRWQPGRKQRVRGPSMDVRGLINLYKDRVWVENARLDRLSLCRFGISAQIYHRGGGIDSNVGLHEDFSVPLP